MTPPARLSAPRSYRRFYEALRALPEMTDPDRFQEGLRVIFNRLLQGAAQVRQVECSEPPVREVGALFDGWDWKGFAPGDDLLGYLFERSLARKALGAYYTPPDVAGYICRAVIIPRLLDLSRVTFDLRRLAGSEGVDRYLSVDLLTPEWLPQETPREHRERQSRVAALRDDFCHGRIATINDCVTRNLDLIRIALDLIERHPETETVRRIRHALHALRICDPTCGTGDFLLAAFEVLLPLHQACRRRLGEPGPVCTDAAHLLRHTLHGQDVHPGAVEVCRMRCLLRAAAVGQQPAGTHRQSALGLTHPASFNFQVEDVLSESPQPPGAGQFDAIIGNPPYVDKHGLREYLTALGYRTARCDNLYAPVVERALGMLAVGGRLGMIVPISSVAGDEYRPLAELLLGGTAWVSTFSNRPAKLFDGVEQRLAIWLVAPHEARTVYTTAYQHWYAEERPRLFSRLEYHRAPVWSSTGMPARVGGPIAERIFRRLLAKSGTLVEWVGEGPAAVWLHDGPTYWVRALPFEPNVGRKSALSAHYRCLPVRDLETARVLAAILSSSTFYFFFKVTGNGRDLGRREWSRFPIGPLSREQWRDLAALGAALEVGLRSGARVRQRVYPSGTVRYEEYFPAAEKPTLDVVDRILAAHYGFTEEELEYILHCDLKYRGVAVP